LWPDPHSEEGPACEKPDVVGDLEQAVGAAALDSSHRKPGRSLYLREGGSGSLPDRVSLNFER
jgi:hypothetical protein